MLFSSLFMALLLQISFLVLEGAAEIIQDQQHVTEWVDPVRYLWPPGEDCVQGPSAQYPCLVVPCHLPDLVPACRF